MNYCFNKSELEQCFDYIFNSEMGDENICLITEDAKYWYNEVYIINFFVSQLIQKNLKKNKYDKLFVEKLYKLNELYNFIIEEIDDKYLDFIISHTSVSNEIEENLVFYSQKRIHYDYGAYLRG